MRLQLANVLAHHPESRAHATVYKASDVGHPATCFALFADVFFRSFVDFLLFLLQSLEFKHSKFIIKAHFITSLNCNIICNYKLLFVVRNLYDAFLRAWALCVFVKCIIVFFAGNSSVFQPISYQRNLLSVGLSLVFRQCFMLSSGPLVLLVVVFHFCQYSDLFLTSC